MKSEFPADENNSRAGRLAWLLLLTAFALVVLVYPLRLADPVLARVHIWWSKDTTGWRAWLQSQLGPYLSFYYSPLVIKTVLAGYALLGFTSMRIVQLLVGRPAKVEQINGGFSQFRGGPRLWLSLALFTGWVIASAFWSPTPPTSLQAAYIVAIYGVSFWLMLRRGFCLPELRTIAWIFVLLGMAALAFLVAQRTPWLLGRIAPTPFADVRNRMGTLIGHNTAAASF